VKSFTRIHEKYVYKYCIHVYLVLVNNYILNNSSKCDVVSDGVKAIRISLVEVLHIKKHELDI
jgi:hypothetical protein